MSSLYEQSLRYHRRKPHGKIGIYSTKPVEDRLDLSLAYTPGVAGPCLAIAEDPLQAAELTARANLIAIATNGTAVLGLGDIGPLASKPVMEGKAILFKKFAGIDAFDLEINEKDPDRFIQVVAALEPTFGAINLEDIKAPECFYIEEKLKALMKIPVFHDDQHGTAIIVAAALLNSLELQKKTIETIRLVVSGAGAASIACLNLLVQLGVCKDNIVVYDSQGMLTTVRLKELDPYKAQYVRDLPAASLSETMRHADVFLGLSKPGVLTEEMVMSMAKKPIIFALANPEPEISPDIVKKVCPEAIVATGRSDYPNQVNNSVCYPYLFRGALDVGATCINEEMKLACVHAIANLTKAESCESVRSAYGDEVHLFGPNYIIPKQFDPRLFDTIACVVAQEAMNTGVATRPISDLEKYRDELRSFVYKSHLFMRPVYSAARLQEKKVRIVYAEGEEFQVLEAIQIIVDDNVARPILIGRPDVIQKRCETLGLRMKMHDDFEVVDPHQDERYYRYWTTYHSLVERRGIPPDVAKTLVRTNTTIIASLMIHLGDAEAMICGAVGRYIDHFRHIVQIVERSPSIKSYSSLCAVLFEHGPLFFCDPYLHEDPTADEIVEMTCLAAEQVMRFGLTPKIALVSHSNFGTSRLPSALKMQKALVKIRQSHPHFEIDGEMHAELALNARLRARIFPNSQLEGRANLLIFPDIESANISYNLLKTGHTAIGPLLLGGKFPVHILTTASSARDIANMSALSVAQYE